MEFNRDYTGDRYRAIAKAMGVEGTETMTQEEYRDAAIAAVRQLSKDVGIPEKNERIREEDLEQLAKDALADACYPGNPREATQDRNVPHADGITGGSVSLVLFFTIFPPVIVIR
jgi:lactaldehyde reductase